MVVHWHSEALELYRKGMMDPEIAKCLGVLRESVRNWRHKNKLAANIQVKEVPAWHITADELYRAGHNDQEIANIIGVARTSVCGWRNSIGYENLAKKASNKWRTCALSLFEQGLNDYSVAKKLNITPSVVCDFRNSMGIPPIGRNKTSGHFSRHNRLSKILRNMISRCNDPKRNNYERYGGKGIYVHDEWVINPHAFIDWSLSNGYAANLQIDRIDTSGPYAPWNCRWVDSKTNNRNKGNMVILSVFGVSKCVSEWAEVLNINAGSIYSRVERKGKLFAEKSLEDYIKKGDKK